MAETNNNNDKSEELKKRHAELLEELGSLYEESPELAAEAPEGLPESLSAPEDAEETPLEALDLPGGVDATDVPDALVVPVAPEETNPLPDAPAAMDATEEPPLEALDLPGDSSDLEAPGLPEDATVDLEDASGMDLGPDTGDPLAGRARWDKEKESRRFARNEASSAKRDDRQARMGRQPDEMDLSDALSHGVRDEEPDDFRETADLADNIGDYSRQLNSLLGMMQEIMLEGISETDAIVARFHRVL